MEVSVEFDGGRLKTVRYRGRAGFGIGDGGHVREPTTTRVPLAAVRQYPTRRRRVLLVWEVLADALG